MTTLIVLAHSTVEELMADLKSHLQEDGLAVVDCGGAGEFIAFHRQKYIGDLRVASETLYELQKSKETPNGK